MLGACLPEHVLCTEHARTAAWACHPSIDAVRNVSLVREDRLAVPGRELDARPHQQGQAYQRHRQKLKRNTGPRPIRQVASPWPGHPANLSRWASQSGPNSDKLLTRSPSNTFSHGRAVARKSSIRNKAFQKSRQAAENINWR